MADEDSGDESVYMYTVPVVNTGGVTTSEYSTGTPNKTYHTYYGPHSVVVIQDTAAGHLHKDNVNAEFVELDKQEVENSDDLLTDFIL